MKLALRLRSELEQRRVALLEGGEVRRLVVGAAGHPASEQDAKPLERTTDLPGVPFTADARNLRKAEHLMHLDVSKAEKEELAFLERLLELYAYELSDIADLHIGADGRFGYSPLPSYWTESSRHPYLVRVDGELAGFILIQQGSRLTGAPEVWDVAEFFVLKRHRRHGVGLRAAHDVWQRHSGPWEVRVMERNTGALGFWRHAVEAFVGSPTEPENMRVGPKTWHVFRFASSRVGA